jgi:hypothetical protein
MWTSGHEDRWKLDRGQVEEMECGHVDRWNVDMWIDGKWMWIDGMWRGG